MFDPIVAKSEGIATEEGVTVRVTTSLFFPYFTRKKQTTIDYFDGDRHLYRQVFRNGELKDQYIPIQDSR